MEREPELEFNNGARNRFLEMKPVTAVKISAEQAQRVHAVLWEHSKLQRMPSTPEQRSEAAAAAFAEATRVMQECGVEPPPSLFNVTVSWEPKYWPSGFSEVFPGYVGAPVKAWDEYSLSWNNPERARA
jgi:hypothetical protein